MAETCIARDKLLLFGDEYFPDVSGGVLHAACCGPERESYCNLETGEPMADGEPIPTPQRWVPGAVEDIALERKRQVTVEGWTPEHDDEHAGGELASAAAAYALHSRSGAGPHGWWPWSGEWWKPKGRRRDLVRAGALIVAEIERLDRQGAE
jgi:hypothetical protein